MKLAARAVLISLLCCSSLLPEAYATTTTVEDATTTTVEDSSVEIGTTTTEIGFLSPSLVISFILTNLDYDLLRADGAKQAALASALQREIASLAGAVSPTDVSIEFALGSVAVTATISPPPGTLMQDLEAQISTSISSGSFDSAILQAVNSVPNIQSLASGTIGVTGISATFITTTTEPWIPADSLLEMISDWISDRVSAWGIELIAIGALACLVVSLLCGAACWGCCHCPKHKAARTKARTIAAAPTAAAESHEDCCTKRMPRIGEFVYCIEGPEVADDEDGNPAGWRVALDEPATVVEVDLDGDFKLQNIQGSTSGWQFRRFFRYPKPEEWELELPHKDQLQAPPRASSKTRMPRSRGGSMMPRSLAEQRRPVLSPRPAAGRPAMPPPPPATNQPPPNYVNQGNFKVV